MAEGRGRLEWGQTSCLLAQFYNANRRESDRALSPDDFNPYHARKRAPDFSITVREYARLRGVGVPDNGGVTHGRGR